MNMLAMNFEGQDVRTVMRGDMPWWVNKDVCKVLEIVKPENAASRLDLDEKDTLTMGSLGGNQKTTIINESGLYSLILTSRKPAAKRFKKWVTSEVLPAIRKNGFYSETKEPDNMPSNSDDVIFGLKVSVLNAAARTAAVIERIYGPEAARALWEKDQRLPQVAHNTITFHANSEDDDPEKCLEHLLRADIGNGLPLVELLIVGMLNRVDAKKLKEYGLILNAPEAEGYVAILNNNRFLSAIFANTHWFMAWQAALLQLKGAIPSGNIKGFRGKNAAVLIPKATIEAVMGKNA